MTDSQVAIILSTNPLFQNLDKEALQLLARKAEVAFFNPGEVILQKGDHGTTMFIIRKGMVKVHDNEFEITRLGSPEFFGEMSLIDNSPRSLSITALKPTELICIHRETLFEVTKRSPEVLMNITAGLTKRIREQDEVVVAQYRERESRLTAMVEERTRQLHEKNMELSETLEKLLQTQKQLIRQEKLAALGSVVGGIAHEINNPLNFICNFSDLAIELITELSEIQTEPTLKEDLSQLLNLIARIREHGGNVAGIVRQMMLHQAKATELRQPQRTQSILSGAFTFALAKMHSENPAFNCRLDLEINGDIPEISVDPTGIQKVFFNLFLNAMQASENLEESAIQVRVFSKEEALHFSIRDFGPGIPANLEEKVFLPFFTTRPPGKGIGLGLPLSYDLIVAHNGTLNLHNHPESGLEVTVVLPLN